MRLYFLLAALFAVCQGGNVESKSFFNPDSHFDETSTLLQEKHNGSVSTVALKNNQNLAEKPEENITIQEVTPKSQVNLVQDPFNILESLGKPNKTKPTNTITSQDFAQATSLVITTSVNVTDTKDTSISNNAAKEDDDLNLIILPAYEVSEDPLEKLEQPLNVVISDKEDPKEDHKNKTELNFSYGTVENITAQNSLTHNKTEPFSPLDIVNLVDSEDEVISNKTTTLVEENDFIKLTNQMSDKIKVYSNEAMLSWEEIKEKVAAENEAANVLKDYKDKITISRAANNTECVKTDQEKYEKRMDVLKDIVSVCEKEINREEWHELQNRTKEILNSINEIVMKVEISLEKLSDKENEDERRATNIEKEAKEKLNKLELGHYKKTLSELKIKALKTDEEDYMKCIDKKAGSEIIVDTLKDIMRIKNNCVG